METRRIEVLGRAIAAHRHSSALTPAAIPDPSGHLVCHSSESQHLGFSILTRRVENDYRSESKPARYSLRVRLVLLAGFAFVLGCDADVASTNPYDPNTPPDKQARASLTGTVLGQPRDGGDPTVLEGATVSIESASGSDTDTLDTPAEGTFEFEDLIPGRVTLEVSHAQYIRQVREVTLEPGENRILQIVLDPLPDEVTEDVGHLTGIAQKSGELALDPLLQDHSGIVVEVEDTGVRTVTNTLGEFDLFLNAGSYHLIFTARNYNLTRRNDMAVIAGEINAELVEAPVVLDANPGSVIGVVRLEGADLDQYGDVVISLLGSVTSTSAADGSYRLTGVAAGSYTLTASMTGFDTQTITGVAVDGGRETQVQDIFLPISRGTVQGSVLLSGEPEHGGTLVELTGTTHTAMTSNTGDYAIEGIAVGTYELTARHDGFVRGVVGGLLVEADTVTDVTQLTLALRLVDFEINGGAPYTNDPAVSLTLTAQDAIEMRISEDSTFADTTWVAFEAEPGFSLSAGDGLKTVYVQYLASDGTEGDLLSASITLDTAPPQDAGLEINAGAEYTNNADGMVTLRFTAFDETSGVQQLRTSNDGVFDDEPWQDFIDAHTHTLADPLTDGLRTVWVLYRDYAGNEIGAPVEASITLDRVEPTLNGFTIDCDGVADAAFCNSPLVELSIDAAGATRMALSNDAGFAVEIFEPLSSSRSWFLPPGDGDKEVWIKLMDEAGNKTVAVSDGITLDSAAPAMPTLVLAGGAAYTADPVSVAVSLTSADLDVVRMRLSTDGVLDDEPWVDYLPDSNVDLPVGDGEKSVFAQVLDAASNTSPIAEAGITLDGTAPQILDVSVGDGSGWVNSLDGSTSVTVQCSDAQATDAELSLLVENDVPSVLYNGAFVHQVPLTLGAAEVTYQLTVTCSDPAGNNTQVGPVTVSVDHTPPAVNSFTLNAGGVDEPTNRRSITVHLADITDNFAGLQAVALSEGVFDCQTANYVYPASGDVGYTLTAGEGSRPLYLCAKDVAGNVTGASVSSDNAVWLDTVAPQSPQVTLAGGANLTNNVNANLSVTVFETGLTLELSGDIDEQGTHSADTPPATVTLNGSDGTKALTALVIDPAGNRSLPASASIVLDTQPPYNTTVVINGGQEYATDPLGAVFLALSASDLVSGVDSMRISNDTVFDEAPIPFEQVRPHSLASPGAEGAKTVYVQFIDLAGNATAVADAAEDSITLDYTPPEIDGYRLNDGVPASPTNSRDVVVRVDVRDAVSDRVGVASALADATFNCDTAQYVYPAQADIPFLLSPGDGLRRVYMCAKDDAGNVLGAAVASNAVDLDTTPPAIPALQVADIDGDGFALARDTVELAWSVPPDTDHLVLERFVQGEGDFVPLDGNIPPAQSDLADDVSAKVGKRLYYRIKAIDEVGNESPWSLVVDALTFDPVEYAFWIRDRDEFRYEFKPNPGTFTMSTTYQNEDPLGIPTLDPLIDNTLSWLRAGPAVDPSRFNEELLFRTRNQDNSLVYESAVPLGHHSRVSVDSIGDVGLYSALAIDANDALHVSYYDSANGDLKYTTNASGAWMAATIDSVNDTGRSTDIFIDPLGYVHISYQDYTNKDIRYATNSSGSWINELVDATGDLGYRGTSIGIDSTGAAWISFYLEEGGGGRLLVANNSGGGWVTEIADNLEWPGQYSSLAVDSADKVHISHKDWGAPAARLEYTTNASGSWVTQTVDISAGSPGHYTSLALDSQGKVHISYQTNGDLLYATNASGSWVTQVADTADAAGYYTSLALDKNDKAHIGYGVAGVFDLRYATNESGSWETMDFHVTGNVGQFASIALDSTGRPHLTYHSDEYQDLMHAVVAKPLWSDEIIDSAGNVGTYASLAMDSNDVVHVAYFDESTVTLKHADNASGAWTTETVDDGGMFGHWVGMHASITVDDSDFLHISYANQSTSAIEYATDAFGGWTLETVEQVFIFGQVPNGIGVDSMGMVHLSYFSAMTMAMRYAFRLPGPFGFWIIQDLDPLPGASGNVFNDLAIDSQDYVHIAYYAGSQEGVHYMTNRSGSFVETVIDSDNWVGSYVSIAIDSADKVHIAYYDNYYNDLRYATDASGTWEVTTVASAYGVGRFASIAIDSLDQAHISHIQDDWGYLMYTTNAYGIWRSTELDTNVGLGQRTYTGIGLDSLDRVHIAYRKNGVSDLAYTQGFFQGILTSHTPVQVEPF